jgi:dynein heavy chain
LRSSNVILTKENIKKEIQFGSISGKDLTLKGLEVIMKGLVEKQVSSNNELTGHYHRCMATLTDTIHYADGRTVLYCPAFEYESVTAAAKDKERLQIMESIVIHWTRQVGGMFVE